VKRGIIEALFCLSGLGGLLALGSGCCFTKRMLGMTSYQVCVQTAEDASHGGNTRVLIVWPTAAKAKEFKDLTAMAEAEKKLDDLSPDDYEKAYLGTFRAGQKEAHFIGADDLGKPLRFHCEATHGFIFTTIDDPNRTGAAVPLLGPGGQPFSGFLQIRLEKESVRWTPLDASHAWDLSAAP